MHRRRREREA
uniref:Uncharacterized protein n=1 Tax=Anguilla anguilla TaxID=7936 RepID=A0A0E9W2J7_ANGAN